MDEEAWVRHAPRLLRWAPSCAESEAHVAAYLVSLGAADERAARGAAASASGLGVYLDRVSPEDVAWLRSQRDVALMQAAARTAEGGDTSCEVVLLAPQRALRDLVADAAADSSLSVALRLLLERAAQRTFTLHTTPQLTLTRGAPAIMGIVNVTPDSFSDGGEHVSPEAAVAHALELVEQGAQILDVGGESTRPGAQPVDEEQEAARVLPVIAELATRLNGTVPLSVDTMKPAVARRAVEAGASLINDVGGFRDPAMVAVAAEFDLPVCCMHMQGKPRTMQQAPHYERDVVAEVDAFLRERTAALLEAGIAREQMVLDPGFGFGKTVAHNFTLLRRLDELTTLGQPVLAGLSRKSSLAAISDQAPPQERLPESLAAHVVAAQHGVSILRVHDVAETRKALAVLRAVNRPDE